MKLITFVCENCGREVTVQKRTDVKEKQNFGRKGDQFLMKMESLMTAIINAFGEKT